MVSVTLRARASLGLWLAALLVWMPGPAAAQDKPVGEAPEERSAEDIFLRSRRVLLGKGELVVDVGQFFSRSDDLQLAVVNNTLALATREQTVLTTVLFGRVGVLNETELFAGTTFYHLRSRVFVGSTELASGGQSEFAGASVGVRRTFLQEAAGRPDIIGSFDALIPKGDTAYVLGGGLTLVKSIDPVVLFAGANYHRSLGRDMPGGPRLEPGDIVDVSLGYGLGLNDTLAISTVASGLFTRSTPSDGSGPQRFDAFTLRFALTSSLAKGLYIEPSVSIGLSGTSQNFTMGVTVPYSF